MGICLQQVSWVKNWRSHSEEQKKSECFQWERIIGLKQKHLFCHEIGFTYTKSFLFLIPKMKYWHLESYLNHAGDSIKVSLERKLTLIQVNEKLCRAMAKWGQYISKRWLKMKLTQVSQNTVSPFFLRLAHKFWWHISIGEENLSTQWWNCLCRKAIHKGIKSRKIRLPCRK